MWDLKRLARVKELVRTATGERGEKSSIVKTLALEFGQTEVWVAQRIRYLQEIGMMPPYPKYVRKTPIPLKKVPRWTKEEEEELNQFYLKGLEEGKTYSEIAKGYSAVSNKLFRRIFDKIVLMNGRDTRPIKGDLAHKWTEEEVSNLIVYYFKEKTITEAARKFISDTNSNRSFVAVKTKIRDLKKNGEII